MFFFGVFVFEVDLTTIEAEWMKLQSFDGSVKGLLDLSVCIEMSFPLSIRVVCLEFARFTCVVHVFVRGFGISWE